MDQFDNKRSIPIDHATRRRKTPYNKQAVYEPPRGTEIKDTEQVEIAEDLDLDRLKNESDNLQKDDKK
ncbi:hypothetical protein [Haloplasma contractile]|nr:hypothetical protein [Haloplasma contractile]